MKIPNFPIFDAHMHFTTAYLDKALLSYKDCGVLAGINLSYPNIIGEQYEEFLKICRKKKLFKKFAQFYWPDWRVFGSRPEYYVKRLVKDMRRFAKLGASGMKVWKDLGMYNFHANGIPAVMDDKRLEPVWNTAAELSWIISVHQADPSTGYLGGYKNNSKTGITREEVFERRDRVVAKHPEITFILCHNGNYTEDYNKLTALFVRFPNVHADLCGFTKSKDKKYPGNRMEFLERFSNRLYLGQDLSLPQNKPPDRPWNRDESYVPLKKDLLSYGLSIETFEKITWKNGVNNILNR